MKYKNIANIALASLLFTTTLSTVSLEAVAQETLSVGNKVTDTMSKKDQKYQYTFKVTEAGKLTLDVQSKANIQVRVYDGNGNNLFANLQLQGTQTNQASHTKSVYVEKGTYYVDVIGDGTTEGDFSFKPTFNTSNSNERESNNTLELAQTIVSGDTINSTLTYLDRLDMYRLEMTKPGSLTVNLDAYMQMDMEIIDSNKNVVLERNTIKGAETSAKKAQYPMLLEEGVYYIKTYATDDFTGKYKLNVQTELFDYSEAITNNLKDTAQPLENNKTLMGSILNGDTTDWYAVEVDKPTKWELDFTSEIPAKIEIYSEDSAPLETYDGYKNHHRTYYLSKGKYYIKIDRKGTEQGLYQLKSKTTSVKNDEGIYNDTVPYAEALPLNKTKNGMLSLIDVADVYKVDISQKGYLNVQLTSDTTVQLSAVDEKEYLVLNAAYAYGTPTKSASITQPIKVTPGTYYLYVKKQPQAMGTYTIKAQFSTKLASSKPKITSVTTPKAGATKITGKATKNSKVTVKIDKKTYTATASSVGKFSVKVPKLKKGKKIVITAKNSAGTSDKKTIVVKK